MIIAIVRIPRPADPAAATAMEQRFAERLPLVAGAPGFLGFELLRPVEGGDQYLSISRWADRAAFDAWAASSANAQAHARPAEGDRTRDHGHGPAHSGPPAGAARPAGPGVELYEVAGA